MLRINNFDQAAAAIRAIIPMERTPDAMTGKVREIKYQPRSYSVNASAHVPMVNCSAVPTM